jgi:hypothetical protein
VPLITRWCSILGTINSAILTAASGYFSSKPGPMVATAPPLITPTIVKILLAAFCWQEVRRCMRRRFEADG